MNNSARLFRPASLPRTGNGSSDLVAELVIKSCFSPSAFMEAAQLPVIRFLQLVYENHNRDLQNFLRAQSNKSSYNLVSETGPSSCASSRLELDLLGLYIKELLATLQK